MCSCTVAEIRNVAKIRVILEWAEWSSAKKAKTIFNECDKRQRQTLFDMGMFMSSSLQASVFMVKNYSDNLHSIKNKEDLSMKQKFDISEKMTTEQSDEIHGISTINWAVFMEVFIFGWWWRSHPSLAHKGLRIFRFCMMPWKDEREPTIKYCMGRQTDVVQKFITIQSLGHSWWWANGIRVEYLSRIHHIAALQQNPRVIVKIERKSLDGLSSCRCSTTSHGDLKTIKKNTNQVLSSFLSKWKDFQQDKCHSSDLDQKRNGIPPMKTVHTENGKELQSKWC